MHRGRTVGPVRATVAQATFALFSIALLATAACSSDGDDADSSTTTTATAAASSTPPGDADTDALPRVGDGVLVLDAQMRVEYSSPNGVSALHRIGVHANAEGMRLGELGLDETPIRSAFEGALPVTRELERGPEVTVVSGDATRRGFRALP